MLRKIFQREPLVHYNSTMNVLQTKSNGEGDCGEHGIVSPYLPFITCKKCRKLFEQENSPENIALVRHTLKGSKTCNK